MLQVVLGTVIKLHFDGALILTHHATNLILPGAANITTAAGDEAEFVEYAAGDYRCTSYTKADGTSVVAAGGGAWELISAQTASASSDIEFTSFLDSSNYDSYAVIYQGIYLSTTAVVNFGLSNDGGSTYISIKKDLAYASFGNAYAYSNGASSSVPINNNGATLDGDTVLNGMLYLHDPANSGTRTSFHGQGNLRTSSSQEKQLFNGVANVAAATTDAFKFTPASGTITVGDFYLYGIKKV